MDDKLVAELRNVNNSTPLLEIYSSDPAVIGEARGYFLARDFLEFRKAYMPFIFANARLMVGPISQDTVATINQKVCERGINTTHKMI